MTLHKKGGVDNFIDNIDNSPRFFMPGMAKTIIFDDR
jgi:hypothetical protein